MSGKSIGLAVLATTLWATGALHGQGYGPQPSTSSTGPAWTTPPDPQTGWPPAFTPVPANAPSGPASGLVSPGTTDGNVPGPFPCHATLSSWVLYDRPCGCCGPVGGHGPIQTDLYFRGGGSMPVGAGALSSVLDAGWMIQGGARVILFDAEMDAAWTVDLGIGHINNSAWNKTTQFTLTNIPTTSASGITGTLPSLEVSVSALNRTYVNLGGGREWYVLGSPDEKEQTTLWRFGVDGGGRYGSAKLDLNEIKHRTDTFGGVYFGLYTDLEIPCCACMIEIGLRGEWAYTWTDLLQTQNNGDLQDLNLMFTIGIRY
jgi:hypothetical protein